jgi:uncharacterized delta-60 repeat protein
MSSGERTRRPVNVAGIGLVLAVVGAVMLSPVRSEAGPILSTAKFSPGDIDPTYGSLGIAQAFKQTFSLFAAPNGTVQTADGKLLVAATVSAGNQEVIGIARFTSAGTLDTAFGNAGQAMTFFKSSTPSPQGVALQPTDGRIVVSGRIRANAKNATYDTLLVRYLPSGSLDSTFGDGGSVIIDLSGTKIDDGAGDLAVQSDGKIIVAADYGGQLVVARLFSDGSLDTSFGTDGKVTPPIGKLLGSARSIAALPNGRILVAARGTAGGTPTTAVVKLQSTGALDSSFGNGGIVQRSFSSEAIGPGTAPIESFSGMIVQASDDKIVLYGDDGGQPKVWVARLNPDGTYDTSFGTKGKMTCPPSFSDGGGRAGMALQTDGKIVLAGSMINPPGAPGAMRINADGTLDGTFGVDGLAVSLSTQAPWGLGVAVQPNGRILVVTAGTTTCTVFGLFEDDPSLTLLPDPARTNGALSLGVSTTHGLNGPILAVEFWLDFDGNGALDNAVDIDLGKASGSGESWGLNVPVIWAAGMHTYFAVVTYASGQTVVSRQGVVKR